jgi:serine/threonine protein kinase
MQLASPKLLGYNSKLKVIRMQFLDGHNSFKSVLTQTNVNGNEIESIKRKVLAQTFKMHSQGMAHRDLHAGNIMVNKVTGGVALIDFGLAASFGNAPSAKFVQRAMFKELTNDLPSTLDLDVDILDRAWGKGKSFDAMSDLSMGNLNSTEFKPAIKEIYQSLSQQLMLQSLRVIK